MNLTELAGTLGFLLLIAACTEDTTGGIDSADASGDSAQQDSAADASEDATLTRPDARIADGMVSRPDGSSPDANISDASPADASIIVPDAAPQCDGPGECDAPDDECIAGEFTDYEPTCASGLCGMLVRNATCPTNSSLCKDLSFVSYSPSCASETACSTNGAESVEICTAPDDDCSAGELTTSTPTCDDATGCDHDSSTSTCPTPASLCRDLDFVDYTPNCADGSTCGKGQESVTACTAQAPSCSGGQVTRHSAICDDDKGCGTTSTTSDCPDSDSVCTRGVDGLELITYEPTCKDGSSCGTPTSKTTVCTAPADSCQGTTLVVETPTCDTKSETCGTNTATTDCSKVGQCIIQNFGASCAVSWTDGLCDPDSGCYEGKAQQAVCEPGKCQCSPKPGCAP